MSDPSPATLTILIPAAGASSRMRGTDKLMAEIDGIPLLRRTAAIALAAHRQVLITLRPQDDARRQALDGLPVQILAIPDAETGLSASLRGAAAAIYRGCLLQTLQGRICATSSPQPTFIPTRSSAPPAKTARKATP
jgi:CTP:molybdopterin cytidylyltransferase MocA